MENKNIEPGGASADKLCITIVNRDMNYPANQNWAALRRLNVCRTGGPMVADDKGPP